MTIKRSVAGGYIPWSRKRFKVLWWSLLIEASAILCLAVLISGPARAFTVLLAVGVGLIAILATMLLSFDVDILTVRLVVSSYPINAAAAMQRLAAARRDRPLWDSTNLILRGRPETLRKAQGLLYDARQVHPSIPLGLKRTLDTALMLVGAVVGGQAQRVLQPPENARWSIDAQIVVRSLFLLALMGATIVAFVRANRISRQRRTADERNLAAAMLRDPDGVIFWLLQNDRNGTVYLKLTETARLFTRLIDAPDFDNLQQALKGEQPEKASPTFEISLALFLFSAGVVLGAVAPRILGLG